jgi:hypothetical protein
MTAAAATSDQATDRRTPALCPRCGRNGTVVSRRIVKIMATAAALAAGVPADPLLCTTPGCPVTYFERSGEPFLTTESVRVGVFPKNQENDDETVCYCFDHTRADIHQRASSERSVSSEIRDLIRAGRCACELRNPKESCCLGDVMQLERDATTENEGGCDVEEEGACCRV